MHSGFFSDVILRFAQDDRDGMLVMSVGEIH
jgi:hypothetical protein